MQKNREYPQVERMAGTLDYQNPQHIPPRQRRSWFALFSLLLLSATFGLGIAQCSGILPNVRPILFVALPLAGVTLGLVGLKQDSEKTAAKASVILYIIFIGLFALGAIAFLFLWAGVKR